ncbi:hypothetical protein [Zobellia galactanivorans]|uniref:Conserved hypothetical membrane protein n=1 Tax=Zobellia galactanivorans (strain DSM 12802 / CCUG 47099 / CIP 106680 / NCIMB 13871 / Dsij) TaxID=63186 RepID=G0LCB4_ZOBGA|nr:hypothetical protein [Zobellia galactanivorans]CAZ96801.1 Conserved hypothetical membrane protein [Zobellia galactanivorans]
MKIPNLPTDNLYKFLSIFGLILFVFGTYLYNTKPNEIYLKVDDYNVKNQILKTNTEKDSIINLHQELINEKIKLNVLEEQINRDIKRLPKELKMYSVIAIIGLIMIGFGFFKWYFKTQYYNDKILKNESEKLKNNKEASIHKIQFEKEFEIYNQLWGDLVNMRNSTITLRPKLDIVNPKESETDRKKRKLEKFRQSFKKCLNTFENNKPFYSELVYEEIDNLIKLVKKEILEYNFETENDDEYWENAENNTLEIIRSTDKICKEMRKRIGLVSIKN